MELKIRMSSSGRDWGFVETHGVYRYGLEGNLKVIASVSGETGSFVTPMVSRGGSFIPAPQIHEEVGLEKYIKAKKPFYSLISDGFIVSLKVHLNFKTGEYIPEKSNYALWMVNESPRFEKNTGYINCRQVLEIPPAVDAIIQPLMKALAETKGDRLEFLKMRM